MKKQRATLNELVSELKMLLSKYDFEIEKAPIIHGDLSAGDAVQTWADTVKLKSAIGYEPKTSVKEGVSRFVKWYNLMYKNND